jgi:DNA-binding transcriptional regulator YdaS (Cro superfamily)
MTLEDYIKVYKIKGGDLAKAAGISHAYLSDIKRGKIQASMNAAIGIHNATGGKVSFNDLAHKTVKKVVA